MELLKSLLRKFVLFLDIRNQSECFSDNTRVLCGGKTMSSSINTCMHIYSQQTYHTHADTCVQAHTWYMCVRTNKHPPTHARRLERARTHTHARILVHTYTGTQTHRHINIHTHTHTFVSTSTSIFRGKFVWLPKRTLQSTRLCAFFVPFSLQSKKYKTSSYFWLCKEASSHLTITNSSVHIKKSFKFGDYQLKSQVGSTSHDGHTWP